MHNHKPDNYRQALQIHRDRVVVDAHLDTVYNFLSPGESYDFQKRNTTGHVDLPRLREGGVNVTVFALWVGAGYPPNAPLRRGLELFQALSRCLEINRQEITLVSSGQQLEGALEQGKVAALVSLEGGEPLEGSLDILDIFYRLGVRLMTLTWNYRNSLGDGVGERETRGGLTRFGRGVVKRMDELGMVIDVSHLSEGGFWDVMELARGPVIASHSNAYALCAHPRNLKDEQVKALAEKGGVVGLNFCPAFIRERGPDLDYLVRHLDYLVDLVGIGHVGIGSDFDGIDETLEGLEDISRLPCFTSRMLARGYREEEVARVLGGNFMRCFQEVLG